MPSFPSQECQMSPCSGDPRAWCQWGQASAAALTVKQAPWVQLAGTADGIATAARLLFREGRTGSSGASSGGVHALGPAGGAPVALCPPSLVEHPVQRFDQASNDRVSIWPCSACGLPVCLCACVPVLCLSCACPVPVLCLSCACPVPACSRSYSSVWRSPQSCRPTSPQPEVLLSNLTAIPCNVALAWHNAAVRSVAETAPFCSIYGDGRTSLPSPPPQDLDRRR
ncbi:hypothetical protein COCMIDRAFT_25286 [Bipolaris oryzae ATCC 44560]|uniref:Uncharacterized protein n=1 Tax=Bipolaris oryzae ATCC 44560 TaxID=930090 RepID=W6ZGY6_COCMI|nr:uncharacterized protein COCMIDRAFT_25286 [Bipolaris oryzae ATCC 44560]EUC46684.1 hypothetical protein COCMIDRAFT_25286 [Bipolaris oryzae ATCC 44560]